MQAALSVEEMLKGLNSSQICDAFENAISSATTLVCDWKQRPETKVSWRNLLEFRAALQRDETEAVWDTLELIHSRSAEEDAEAFLSGMWLGAFLGQVSFQCWCEWLREQMRRDETEGSAVYMNSAGRA
jgi:hypothetical protein